MVKRNVILNIFIYFYFKCVSILPAHMPAHHVLTWCSWSPEEDVGPAGPGLQTVVSCRVAPSHKHHAALTCLAKTF